MIMNIRERQRLVRIIQSSWRNRVRRINSEEEQFKKEAYGLDSLEQTYMTNAYSKRRALARQTYIIELNVINRAHRREEIGSLSIPSHVSHPKYF